MKRLHVILLLVTFIAGPALAWFCGDGCGKIVQASSSQDCHGAGATGLKVRDGHDCGEHVLPVVPATKETRYQAVGFQAAVVESDAPTFQAGMFVTYQHVAPPAPDLPSIVFGIPLRI